MNTVVKNILVVFFALISLISCKTTRMEYSSDKFVVIEATVSDSFKSLAEKYLKDEKNDWLVNLAKVRKSKEDLLTVFE